MRVEPMGEETGGLGQKVTISLPQAGGLSCSPPWLGREAAKVRSTGVGPGAPDSLSVLAAFLVSETIYLTSTT